MAVAWTAEHGGIDCGCVDPPVTTSTRGRRRLMREAAGDLPPSSTATNTTTEARTVETAGNEEPHLLDIRRHGHRLVAVELPLPYTLLLTYALHFFLFFFFVIFIIFVFLLNANFYRVGQKNCTRYSLQ